MRKRTCTRTGTGIAAQTLAGICRRIRLDWREGINHCVYANGNSLVIIDPRRRHSIVIPVPSVISIGGDSTVFMRGAIAVGIVGAGALSSWVDI